jgi:hypothetical protein
MTDTNNKKSTTKATKKAAKKATKTATKKAATKSTTKPKTSTSLRSSLLSSLGKAGLDVTAGGPAAKFVDSTSNFLGDLVDDGSEVLSDVSNGIEEAVKKATAAAKAAATPPAKAPKVSFAQFNVEVKLGIHIVSSGVAYAVIPSEHSIIEGQEAVHAHIANNWPAMTSNAATYLESKCISTDTISQTEYESLIASFDVDSPRRFCTAKVLSRIFAQD